jgi:transposase
MFIRKQVVKKGPVSNTYLKLVENYRQKGNVVQKTLVNFGNINHWPQEKVRELICKLSQVMDIEVPASLEDIEHKGVLNFGQPFALGLLWDDLTLGETLERLLATSPFLAPIKTMVFNRLIDPHSELATSQWVKGQYIEGVPGDIPLHHYYRALNQLVEIKTSLEDRLYNTLNTLFTLDFSLLFYDLTSTYFEGEGPCSAKKGYSRDHRADRPQVEIGLLVNRDGIPLSHMVFDGNVKDATTLPQIVDQMRGTFQIKRCIFVGDKGMVTSKNLTELSRAGYEYIVSIKLRRSKEAEYLLGLIPDRAQFTQLKDNLLVYELPSSGAQRSLACYNPIRAQETRDHREELLTSCEEFLSQFHLPPKQGKTKDPVKVRLRIDRFLRQRKMAPFFHYGFDSTGTLQYQRKDKEIAKEAALDGLFIITTNSKELSAEALALGYKTLWEVEHAFREVKDFIKIRPIYHHNGERVRGHIFICFLAYLLEKLLEKKLEDHGLFMSARKALQELSSVKVVISELAGQQIKKVTSLVKEQEQILRALGAHRIPRIVP